MIGRILNSVSAAALHGDVIELFPPREEAEAILVANGDEPERTAALALAGFPEGPRTISVGDGKVTIALEES